MNGSNSIETMDRANLTEQTKFWLHEISKTESYYYQKINQRKSCSKTLTKYVTVFDYIDQALMFSVQQVVEYQLFCLQVLLEHQLE